MKNINVDIAKIKYGDENAFRHLFDLLYPRLLAFACQFVTETAAEDIVQSIFVQLWEDRKKLKIQSFKSYIYRCVQNDCLNYLKHQSVVSKHAECVRLAQERIAFFQENTDENYMWEELVDKDLKEKVLSILDQLSVNCRKAFELSFYDGLTYKEIGEELNVSSRTVEDYMRKSFALLRKNLKSILMQLLLLFYTC